MQDVSVLLVRRRCPNLVLGWDLRSLEHTVGYGDQLVVLPQVLIEPAEVLSDKFLEELVGLQLADLAKLLHLLLLRPVRHNHDSYLPKTSNELIEVQPLPRISIDAVDQRGLRGCRLHRMWLWWRFRSAFRAHLLSVLCKEYIGFWFADLTHAFRINIDTIVTRWLILLLNSLQERIADGVAH